MAQSDANLIKGAYAAAGGGIKDKGLAAAQGMTAIGNVAGAYASTAIQKANKEFEAFAEWELGRTPGLNDAEYRQKTQELMDMKGKYIWGDNATQAEIMRELNEHKVAMQQLEDAKKNFAEAGQDSESGTANNDEFKLSETTQSLIKMMKDGPVVYQDGVAGYMIEVDGEKQFFSPDDINRIIAEESFDKGSADLLFDYTTEMLTDLESSVTYPKGAPFTKPFDWEGQYKSIAKDFVGQGSIRSLAKDEILGGQTFDASAMELFQTMTYKDLLSFDYDNNPDTKDNLEGILPENFEANQESGEYDYDAQVSEEDARIILDNMYKDDKLTRLWLTTYYTSHLQDNYNAKKKAIGEEWMTNLTEELPNKVNTYNTNNQ